MNLKLLMCDHHTMGEAKEGQSEKVSGSCACTNTGTPYMHLEINGKKKGGGEGWREAEFQAGWEINYFSSSSLSHLCIIVKLFTLSVVKLRI